MSSRRSRPSDLRRNGGYSYIADSSHHPRDNDFATITAFADALPKKQDAVVGGFVDVLARLRAGRIEQSELDSARAKILKQYDTPDARPPAGVLAGRRAEEPDPVRAEVAADRPPRLIPGSYRG
ncbi:hypothetical protein ACWD6R_07155 [Streptomyces sp. NPDC005151]